MFNRRLGIGLLVLAGAVGGTVGATTDPASFPERLTLREGGREIEVTRTGTAERNILVVKVYRMAHYLEAGGAGGSIASVDDMLSTTRAKHIRLIFLRDLPKEKIKAELQKSMRRNAKEDWIAQSGGGMDEFLAAINRDAAAGDELTLSWFAGGRIVAEFNGERALEMENAPLARILWSIWFGERPVVRREDLFAATGEG